MLPDGEPKQLTRDDHAKMSPAFSPDGSRIAYTTVDSKFEWDVWTVPVLGGQPPLADKRLRTGMEGWPKVLFSKLKVGTHMAVETSEESRAGERDVYFPAY